MRMLDLFLLDGMHSSKVIFDMTIGYLQSIEGKVTQARDQEELQEALQSMKADFEDCTTLMANV